MTSAVCEGELDALLLAQLGLDAITSTGGAGDLARRLRGVRLPRRVYVLTDQDDAGDAAAFAVREARTSTDWVRVRWDRGKDVTEALAPLPDADRVSLLRRWLQ
jgi:DNA primase